MEIIEKQRAGSLRLFADSAPVHQPPTNAELTPREFEVFELLAIGMTNLEIAAQLVVSAPTVKTHVTSILTKLGVRNRVQAVVLAYETGVFTPGWTALR